MEENKKDVLPLEGEPLTAPQISEPVVNALAAALSKIETYVPTQYVDDGPPDIDADHLNHAEQAIMRVTNLANGAADAIAALQSQVTQLNNNFQLTDNATRFVAGSSEKSKAYLRTFDVSGRLFQLALSESGLLFSGYNGDYGSSGKILWEGVTRSDLTPSVYPIPKPSSINGMDNISIWEVRVFKSGKIVCLTLNINGVLSANTDWKMLFTLPKEYRPSEGSIILNYITQYGKAMVMNINTGGDVKIVCPSGEGILKGDWVCRQCITYITKN